MKQFFGKYRGKVENNVDPQQQGRVQVSVPAVLGSGSLSWAMPCMPYAGPQVGLFTIPVNVFKAVGEFVGPTCGLNLKGAIPTTRSGAVVSGDWVKRQRCPPLLK